MKLFLINLASRFRFDREDFLRKEMSAYNKNGQKEKKGNRCYLETRGGKAYKLHYYRFLDEIDMKPDKVYKQKLCNGEEIWYIRLP